MKKGQTDRHMYRKINESATGTAQRRGELVFRGESCGWFTHQQTLTLSHTANICTQSRGRFYHPSELHSGTGVEGSLFIPVELRSLTRPRLWLQYTFTQIFIFSLHSGLPQPAFLKTNKTKLQNNKIKTTTRRIDKFSKVTEYKINKQKSVVRIMTS